MLTNETVSALQSLAQTTSQLHHFTHAQAAAIEQARQAGASWAAIARIVGTTRQALAANHQRRQRRHDRDAVLF